MGFFKRLLSIGTKKKKRTITHNVPLPEKFITPAINDEEHEAAVGKLLRSTSARFSELPELNSVTLPPIPHPINKVIQTPASSTVSLDSTSLSQRGTYNVTVHRRRRHASTEFPHANRDLDDNNDHGGLQPVEDSRILGLRSDPSVVSLLELYDEHGRLANDAFANNDDESLPIQEGRAQARRSGSTLRQLLGAPSTKSGNDNSEGDISWAERYLAESDATSVISSSGLKTPEISPFNGEATAPEVSITSDADLSFTAFNNPGISSMEVEVNNSYDASGEELDASCKLISPYASPDPATPQRASQIFDFLTKQKMSKPPTDFDRTLPELPSCFSSPSEEGSDKRSSKSRDTLARLSFNPNRFSAPSIPFNNDTRRPSRPRSSFMGTTPRQDIRRSQELHSAFSDDSHDCLHNNIQPPVTQTSTVDVKQNDVQILMTGPTKVILTAPTPGTNHVGPRLLSGPRPLIRKSSSGSVKRRRSVLGEVSSNSSTILGDPFVIVSPKQKPRRDRRSSMSSIRSFSRQEYERNDNYISHPKKPQPNSPASNMHKLKENELSLSVKNDLPSTPLRLNASATSRSLFRNVFQPGKVRGRVVPDSNLSSELSPVGRQIMDDVRQQRMRAREADRARLGNRF